MKTHSILAIVGAVALLAACGDKTQTIGQDIRSDTPAFQGTGKAFAVPGWKQGDKASWEQELKTRTQAQNDYVKVN
jgi:hypothetical protein